jgi:hypothetical protein
LTPSDLFVLNMAQQNQILQHRVILQLVRDIFFQGQRNQSKAIDQAQICSAHLDVTNSEHLYVSVILRVRETMALAQMVETQTILAMIQIPLVHG